MLSTPTLLTAQRHLKKLLQDAQNRPDGAADAMAYQISLDCIAHCIEVSRAERERQIIDQKIDRCIIKLMDEPRRMEVQAV